MPALGLFAYLGEALIKAVLREKLLVCAALGDAPVVYDEDLIGVLDRRKPVGDRDDRFAARKRRDRVLDEVFVFRVDARGGLVEQDDGRILENGAGNGDALLLADGVRAFCMSAPLGALTVSGSTSRLCYMCIIIPAILSM